MIIIDSKGIELSVAKATLQSQMSVHPFICLSSKPPSTLILHLSTIIFQPSSTFKLFSLLLNKRNWYYWHEYFISFIRKNICLNRICVIFKYFLIINMDREVPEKAPEDHHHLAMAISNPESSSWYFLSGSGIFWSGCNNHNLDLLIKVCGHPKAGSVPAQVEGGHWRPEPD